MLQFAIVVSILNLALTAVMPEPVRYEGYSIYKVIPQTLDHLNLLQKFEIHNEALVFFDAISITNKSIHILVSPTYQQKFRTVLDWYNVFYELVLDNFQKVLDEEYTELQKRSSTYDWTSYHTLNETYEWLETLVTNYPNQVQLLVGGQTFEGRKIRGVKVSFKPGNKGIFLEGGIHACEWISPATVTYLLNEILTNSDANVRSIVESFDWYVFPHYNPDGFVYTHTTDRLWRKTRSKGISCYGADPNRNWGFRWMETGASSDECSFTFGGKNQFSEIETKTLSAFLLTLKGKIHTYVAFHSYGQVLVFPYAATKKPVPNNDDLHRIGEATTKELSKRYGTHYKVGSVYDVIYPAAGSSPDWVYGVLNVPIVFTYELRPMSSTNGFILPSAQIEPSGQETFDSLLGMIIEAKKIGYYN